MSTKQITNLTRYKNLFQFQNILHATLFLWIFSIPLKNSVYQISTVLLILLFLIHIFKYKKWETFTGVVQAYKELFMLLFSFVLVMLFSTLLSYGGQKAFSIIFAYIYRYIAILSVLFYFYNEKLFTKKWLLGVIYVTLIVNALDGLYQYITGADFIKGRELTNHRISGAVYNANPFGILMSIGAYLSFIFYLNVQKKILTQNLLHFFSFLLFSIALLLSGSRASWIMFSILLIGYLAIYIRSNGLTKKVVFLVAVFAATSLSLLLYIPGVIYRFKLLLHGYSSLRTEIWLFALDKIKEHPVLGYGVNTFKQLAIGTRFEGIAGIHNLTLEITLFTGVVGLILFSYLILRTAIQGLKNRNYSPLLLLLSYLILLQFDGSLIDGKIHLNIFILILFYIYTSHQQPRSLESAS